MFGDFAPWLGLRRRRGLAFVALIGWRFIPQRENNVLAPKDLSPYLAEASIPKATPKWQKV